MNIYNYDPVTFEFLGVTNARQSPKEPDVYLIPAYATANATTKADEGYARQYDVNEDTWITVEDNRGNVVYRKADAVKFIVDWLGEIGEDYTNKTPSSPDDTWDGAKWVKPTPTVDKIKIEARRRIEEAIPSWMVERHVTSDKKISQTILDYAQNVRDASDALEQSLPSDYQDDKHWPDKP